MSTTNIFNNSLSSVLSLIQATEQHDTNQQIASLSACAAFFPRPFVASLQEALRTNNRASVSDLFAEHQFLNPDGTFLLMGDYTTRRGGLEHTERSVIYGRVLPVSPLPDLRLHLETIFGEVRQEVPIILPIEVFAASGGLADDGTSEAFIVPDGWGFPSSERGPALNNMPEQRRRFLQAGRAAIRAIFEPETAELLLTPYKTKAQAFQTIQTEYQVHDAGHASGLGIGEKVRRNLLTSPFYRAVEEWRSDGVAFELLSRSLPEEEAAMVIASNFNTRFGIDALRAGQLSDTDINATMLTLSRLIWGGEWSVSNAGKLQLADPTPRGLLRSVELMQADAIALTRKELRLQKPEDLWHLFGTVPMDALAVALFQATVTRPTHHLHHLQGRLR